MERQILVPLDGSPLAETAIPHAVLLARATDSTLHVMRSVTLENSLAVMTWTVPTPDQFDHWMEDLYTEARQYIAGVAAHLRTADLAVETTVVDGNPVDRMLTLIATVPAIHAVVLASHGRHGLERWRFGSVAEQVIQAQAAPVLVVPVQQHEDPVQSPSLHTAIDLNHTYTTILVPLDGSPFAEHALEPARRLAERCAATLVLVSIVPFLADLRFGVGGMIPEWTNTDQQRVHQSVTAYLETTAQRVVTGGVRVRTRVIDGPPATMIAATATEEHADLIVMATHGRSGLSRLWLGSVATRVFHQTDVPVLLIPAEEPHAHGR